MLYINKEILAMSLPLHKLSVFEWDPTEPVATRPLFMQQRNPGGDSLNNFVTHDGNKNVTEVVSYQRARGVVAHYDYAPLRG